MFFTMIFLKIEKLISCHMLFKILLFISKRKFSFYSVPLICRFLNSETSINFSSFIGEIFLKTQNFDSYDVIKT